MCNERYQGWEVFLSHPLTNVLLDHTGSTSVKPKDLRWFLDLDREQIDWLRRELSRKENERFRKEVEK